MNNILPFKYGIQQDKKRYIIKAIDTFHEEIVEIMIDGHQFHQNQKQNEQSHLILTELTEHKKDHI